MRNETYSLVLQESLAFIEVLDNLFDILQKVNCNTQAEFIKKLLQEIKGDELSDFVKSVNSVDMWGGSGAVWEVYIEDRLDAKMFEQQIINLIDLMERTGILGNGIKPIRKLFAKNLER